MKLNKVLKCIYSNVSDEELERVHTEIAEKLDDNIAGILFEQYNHKTICSLVDNKDEPEAAFVRKCGHYGLDYKDNNINPHYYSNHINDNV